jgi:hypothetical protein
LVDAENFQRDIAITKEKNLKENLARQCFSKYVKVAQQFEELNDYETASYFYKRCLDVSVDATFPEGQAKAYKGLGICEEKVLNIFESKN